MRKTSLPSEKLSPRTSRSKEPSVENSLENTLERRMKRFDEEFKNLSNLPPKPRPEERRVRFLHETGPRGEEVVKHEETRLSRRDFSDRAYDKPPVSVRQRKISASS